MTNRQLSETIKIQQTKEDMSFGWGTAGQPKTFHDTKFVHNVKLMIVYLLKFTFNDFSPKCE